MGNNESVTAGPSGSENAISMAEKKDWSSVTTQSKPVPFHSKPVPFHSSVFCEGLNCRGLKNNMAVSFLGFLITSQTPFHKSLQSKKAQIKMKQIKTKKPIPLVRGPENGYLNNRNLFCNSHPTATAKSLQPCLTLCDPIPGTSQEHWSGLPFPSPVHKSEK